eukprot:TRINITY_DN4197_c0_g1_i4.p2 TRINITY_DN4197_c0_g1~~TRINITY_DN4197_c0_g1_i4.p2  ORF type:complete len:150 (-),score=35.63 TRINITY_DN4197_c0_g1_i4:222-671(-)
MLDSLTDGLAQLSSELKYTREAERSECSCNCRECTCSCHEQPSRHPGGGDYRKALKKLAGTPVPTTVSAAEDSAPESGPEGSTTCDGTDQTSEATSEPSEHGTVAENEATEGSGSPVSEDELMPATDSCRDHQEGLSAQPPAGVVAAGC